MKKVKMVKLSEREKQNALNEVHILASINHSNIIGYKEAFFEDSTSSLCIIMEYADGGYMMKLINTHKKKGTRFSEKEVWYSKDLQFLVRNCLQVQSTSKPTPEKLLAMLIVTTHISETLEAAEKEQFYQEVNLLNTIKVSRDLGKITERLPKPQYGNVMRRNKSLPPEKKEKLPDSAKKQDNLL